MPKLQYDVHLFWDNQDQIWVAKVPELPGCMAHGATQQEALTSVIEAAGAWIEVAAEEGREIPEPKWKTVQSA